MLFFVLLLLLRSLTLVCQQNSPVVMSLAFGGEGRRNGRWS